MIGLYVYVYIDIRVSVCVLCIMTLHTHTNIWQFHLNGGKPIASSIPATVPMHAYTLTYASSY
jgi:hypothetical protein